MVTKGYKQTEIGVIPEEWDVLPIENIFAFFSTSNYSKAQMDLHGEFGCIHYGLIHAIQNSNYDVKRGIKYYVSSNKAKYELLQNGDIIMVDASEDLVNVNKSVEMHGIREKKIIAGLHTFLLRDVNNNMVDGFRGVILNSETAKKQYVKLAVGMKVYGVSKPQLKSVLIPLPPLPEQTAIAEALSDMDALIAQTEQLIEKKKAIKQGMMHELLTPKEGWVTKKLGEIAELKNGYAFKSAYYNQAGEFLIITIANVQDGHMEIADCNRISHIPDTVQSFQKLNIGDILISMTGNVGRICKVNTYKTLLNQRVGKITPTNIDGDFLFYLLRDKRFINKMILSAQGGAQGNIGKSDILDYEASLPPTPKEQARIAQILSDMDSEIEQLEKQLSKAQSIKQGMMQQLLTGKTRLI